MYRILLIFFFFLIITLSAFCQEIKFHTPNHGISQNTITSFCQDELGFLWIGTHYGLNRYDGSRYEIFLHDTADKESISSSNISCLTIDNQANLWIGTNGRGINILNTQSLHFVKDEKYKELIASLEHEWIACIFHDSKGNIWVGTERKGLFFWSSNTHKAQHLDVHSSNIVNVFEDKDQQIWTINSDRVFCKVTNPAHIICENITNTKSFRSAIKNSKDEIWLGTNQGLYQVKLDSPDGVKLNRIQSQQPHLDKLLNTYVILSLLEDSQSRLWIGTENHGLFLYDLNTKELQQFQKNPADNLSLKGNSIWSLYEDENQIVWIGTYKTGINQFSPYGEIFHHNLDYPHLKISGLITDFAESENGNLWVSTDNDGLFEINLNDKDVHSISGEALESKVITCLLNDKSGNLWVATWDKGLFVKKANTNFFQAIPIGENGTSNESIKTLFEDSKGHIWISSFRKGLDRYNPEDNTFNHYLPNLTFLSVQSSVIMSIAEDSEGNLWLGSGGKGLNKISLNDEGVIVKTINYVYDSNNPNSLSNNIINHLFIDSNQQLWIATDGNGLDKYNPIGDDFENINVNHGLPSNVIYGILEHTENQLWISTNQGLASINMEDDNVEVKSFEVSDGLQSNEFNKSACYKAKDGQLYFGGINGFNFFDPSKLTQESITPSICITSIEIQHSDKNNLERSNQKIELPKEHIKLAAKQNDIRIDFTALNYIHTAKNEYAYQLENHDSDWRYISKNNYANYSNLNPGNYTFKVKTTKSNGEWSDQIAQLPITISRPWYTTVLAYFIYTFLIAAFLFLVYKSLLRQHQLSSKLEIETIEKSKIQELNQLRSQFFANITHEFKTPLTLLISPLKALENDEEYQIDKKQGSLMLNNAERLHRLIDQILSLSKLESGVTKLIVSKTDIVETTKSVCSNFKNLAQDCSIDFQIQLPSCPVDLYFEKDKMEQIIINFLSNAFKFTKKGGSIRVELKVLENNVQFIFADNGIGIPKEQLDLIFDRYYRGNTMISDGTGIGLSITKQLIELHHGKVSVSSKPQQGTIFEITFPKGKEHFKDVQIEEAHQSDELSSESLQLLNELNVLTTKMELEPIEEDDLPLLLIAEDNDEIRAFTKDYFSKDFKILEARDGEEAWELASTHIPDIIITDLMMPRMDGYALCEKLRADEKTCHIFIVMLTVKASEKSQTKGFEMGADFYITKPFNPKLLALRINNILRTRNQFKVQLLDNIKLDISPSVVEISSKDEIFLNDIMQIIEQNIDNANFGVEDLSRAMTFSKSQLYRKLKGLVGQSANEFIRTIRLKRAVQLLENDDLNITEIAYQVGFNDLHYFRKCFKKEYNMTPSQYKKKSIKK